MKQMLIIGAEDGAAPNAEYYAAGQLGVALDVAGQEAEVVVLPRGVYVQVIDAESGNSGRGTQEADSNSVPSPNPRGQ